MRTHGIDVSHWEGQIDWAVAAQWIPFVYYKCTDGIRGIDLAFAANKDGCSAAGIPHAPYHWFQPEQDPILQAEHFIRTAGKDYKRYIADVEQAPVSISGFVNKLYSFLTRVEFLTGSKPAIYTSASKWNDYIKPKPSWAREYDLIVAHYTLEKQPILPIGWSTWLIWQYAADYFYFPGSNTAADSNWFNGTLQSCRDWFGNYQDIDPVVGSKMRVRSLFDNLHIRQAPSTSAKALGYLNRGDIVEVQELGGLSVWVHHSRGWTAVERAGYRYMEVLK